MPRWSDSDGLPRKNLREGTHSCLECRRRKVRCNFEPHTHKCVQCLRRDNDCTPQQYRDTPSFLQERSGHHDLLTQSLKQILNQHQQTSSSSANISNGTDLNKTSSEFQYTQFSKPASTQNLLLSANDAELVIPNCAPLFSLFNRSTSPRDQRGYTNNDLQIL